MPILLMEQLHHLESIKHYLKKLTGEYPTDQQALGYALEHTYITTVNKYIPNKVLK